MQYFPYPGKYARPSYKRMLDIMFVAHIYGYKELKGRELTRVLKDLHPEVSAGSASSSLAGLSSRGLTESRVVKREDPRHPHYHDVFRYHRLTVPGLKLSRFSKCKP